MCCFLMQYNGVTEFSHDNLSCLCQHQTAITVQVRSGHCFDTPHATMNSLEDSFLVRSNPLFSDTHLDRAVFSLLLLVHQHVGGDMHQR